MTIDPILTNESTTGSKAKGKDSTALGKEDFLKILLTQIKYQDPLDPLKPADFLSQLAQLTSVETLENIEESLKNVRTCLEKQGFAHALDLMGRKVEVSGNVASSGDEILLQPEVDFDRIVLTLLDQSDGTKKEVTIKKGEPLSLKLEEPGDKLVYASAFSNGREVGCGIRVYRTVRGISMDGSTLKLIFSDGTTEHLDNVKSIRE